MRVLEGLDPATVGVILDPGNFAFEGLENITMLVDVGAVFTSRPRKNAKLITTETTNSLGFRMAAEWCILQDGVVDWNYVLERPGAAGYDGWYSIENFDNIEVGPNRLADDLRNLLACRRVGP